MATRRKKPASKPANRGGSPAPAAPRRKARVASSPQSSKRRGATGAKPSQRGGIRKGLTKRNDRTPTKAKRPSPTNKRGFAGIVARTAGKKPPKATARKIAQARELGRSSIRRDAARRAAQARKANAYRRSQAAKRGWQKRREVAHQKPTRFQVRVPFATFEQIRAGRKPPTPAQVAKGMRKALKMVAENMRKLYPTAVQDGYFALGLERAISRQIKGPVWEMEASPVWTGATHYMEALGDDKPELLASDNMGSAKPYRVAVLAVMADGFVRATDGQ